MTQKKLKKGLIKTDEKHTVSNVGTILPQFAKGNMLAKNKGRGKGRKGIKTILTDVLDNYRLDVKNLPKRLADSNLAKMLENTDDNRVDGNYFLALRLMLIIEQGSDDSAMRAINMIYDRLEGQTTQQQKLEIQSVSRGEAGEQTNSDKLNDLILRLANSRKSEEVEEGEVVEN